MNLELTAATPNELSLEFFPLKKLFFPKGKGRNWALFRWQVGREHSASAPVLLINVVKQNVERFGFNAANFVEVLADSAHEFLLLFLGSSLVHVNVNDWHRTPP
jgi:hypothetical protein